MNTSADLNATVTKDTGQQTGQQKQTMDAHSVVRKQLRNNLLQAKPRSAFAAIIAETYFIPGITGRARCLQDYDPPERATSFCDHDDNDNNKSLRNMTRSGQYPEPNPISWEIEGRCQRLIRKELAIVAWAEPASFVLQPHERVSKAPVMLKVRNGSTSTPKTLASDSFSHSEGTMQTIQSRTTQRDDDSQRSLSESMRKKGASHSPLEGRPNLTFQGKWLDDRPNDPHVSTETRLSRKKQSSMQPPFHDFFQEHEMVSKTKGSRPAGLVRSASSRSCRRHREHGGRDRRSSPGSWWRGSTPTTAEQSTAVTTGTKCPATSSSSALPSRIIITRSGTQSCGGRSRDGNKRCGEISTRLDGFDKGRPPLVVSFHVRPPLPPPPTPPPRRTNKVTRTRAIAA